MFDLKYNLFENEIERLIHLLGTSIYGKGEYEGDDGWLHDNESIEIIEKQLDEMSKNRNISKNIIVNTLNDNNNEYPENVKDFYLEWLNVVINDKNEFTYNGKKVDEREVLKDKLIDYIHKNNFVYKDYNKEIIHNAIMNNPDYVDGFADFLTKGSVKYLMLSNGNYGKAIEEFVENNTKECIAFGIKKDETELDKRLKEKEERLKDEEPKIHNKKDFEKLSEFANKLTKENLNELQNILIQCEYDTNVLSDFTSAVDKVSVNKNMTEDQIHINTILVYDTKENSLYDMSIIDKQENAKFSFEKYVDFLEEHKANNLVMIQAKEPSFNSFDNKESNIIRVLFDVSKTNGNKLMDFVAVSVDTIKKNGMGEFNTKGLISNKCYSYKFKTSENFKNHISKLEINEQMKAKQGLYANAEVKTESNSYKAPK